MSERVFFMTVFLSKYAQCLLKSLQKRHVSNSKLEQILFNLVLMFPQHSSKRMKERFV